MDLISFSVRSVLFWVNCLEDILITHFFLSVILVALCIVFLWLTYSSNSRVCIFFVTWKDFWYEFWWAFSTWYKLSYMIYWHYLTSSCSGSQFYCFCLGQIIRSKFSWFRLGLLISYKYAQHAHLHCPMMRKVSKVSRNVASLNIVVHDVINL